MKQRNLCYQWIFYSPLSEGSAADRISGCKFFGTIATSKDTMTYHLVIAAHLSLVGATTGRLWHRLINYYAQDHQSDDFSERLVIIFDRILKCFYLKFYKNRHFYCYYNM